MRGHHAVAAIDLGVVERGLVDTGLEVVRHDEPRHAAEPAEHAHMGADPVGQGLRPRRLGIGEARGAEHGDEDLRLADDAGRAVDDGDLLAGIVDEHLVAGRVILPHDRREPPLERAEQIAEPAVAIALRVGLAILLPQQHQIDAGPLQLAGERRPVRLRSAAKAPLHAGAGEQPLLERDIGQLGRQRPGEPRRLGSLQIVLDRAARHAEHPPDLARADAVADQPQYLSYLPHGQLSPRRHQVLLVDDHEGLMPELLTRRKTPNVSDGGPAIDRNPGRLQFGMVAAFKSERWPASPRNTRPASVGIRITAHTRSGHREKRVRGTFRGSVTEQAPTKSLVPYQMSVEQAIGKVCDLAS
jgi:hypothetical protein